MTLALHPPRLLIRPTPENRRVLYNGVFPPTANPHWRGPQAIRPNGAVVAFDPEKISVAVTKAFLAVEGTQSATSSRVREVVALLDEYRGSRRPVACLMVARCILRIFRTRLS